MSNDIGTKGEAAAGGGPTTWRQLSFPNALTLLGLCLYTFSVVTYRLDVVNIGLVLAGVGMALNLRNFRLGLPVALFITFLFWALVGALLSSTSSLALEKLVELAKLLVIMAIVANALNSEGEIRLYLLFFLFCFLLYPLRGALLGGETVFGRAVWGRYYGNPNDLAAFCIIALGVALAIASSASTAKWIRLGAGGSVVLLLITILLTQSRGAFLGLVIGMGPGFLKTGARHPIKAVVAVGVLAAIIAAAVPHAAWERFAGIKKLTSEETIASADPEGSAEERLAILRGGLQLVRENPVLGTGIGSFGFHFAVLDPYLGQKDAHNTYLRLAAEVGLVGLVLWCAVPGSVLYLARRARKNTCRKDLASQLVWLERALVSYLIAGIFASLAHLAFSYVLMMTIWCSAKLLATAAYRTAPSVPLAERPEASDERAVIGSRRGCG